MSDFDFFDIAVQMYETRKIIEGKIQEIPEPDTVPNTDECQHTDVASESGIITCQECGEELKRTISYDKEWRYYGAGDNKKFSDPNRIQARKQEEKSIRKDVENMGFSDKIVSMADEIYSTVTDGQILRGDSRKAVIFGCISKTYGVLGKYQPAEPLIAQFGITKKKALKGLKIVSINAHKIPGINATVGTPVHLINDIMNKFSATLAQKEEVSLLYEKIRNRSTKLNRSRPQSVAAALVYYWICRKKLKITLKEFSKKIELTEQTITKNTAEIILILGPA